MKWSSQLRNEMFIDTVKRLWRLWLSYQNFKILSMEILVLMQREGILQFDQILTIRTVIP